jgi:hypothetical protein
MRTKRAQATNNNETTENPGSVRPVSLKFLPEPISSRLGWEIGALVARFKRHSSGR